MGGISPYIVRLNSTTQRNELRSRGRTTLTFGAVQVPPLTASLTSSSTAPQSGATITLTATANGGVTPYTYVFKDPSGATIAGTGNTRSLTASLSGIYQVTVTDSSTPTAQTQTATVNVAVSSSRMQPPAGMALLHDLTRIANWVYVEPGSTVIELSGQTGPSGDIILRNTCIDDQINTPGAEPSERSDLSGPDVPYGSTRWMIWDERIMQLPATITDRWQILGPCEIHGETLTQATFMPEVDPNHRRRLNANAGLSSTRYFDIGPIVIGQWYQMKVGIFYTQSSAGWFEVWRDGVQVIPRVVGQTTAENYNGYWKYGNYRAATIQGTTQIDVSGCRVYG